MADVTDVQLAVATLLAKADRYNLYWSYYDGDHPLVYSADRLESLFKNLKARFTQNWSAVVVDSVLERIQLQRITVADDDQATARLDELMAASELALESDDVHLAAIVTGEAYVIAWKEEEGEPEAYYNDSRLCHVFYDPAKPRQKRFACKWWLGDDGYRYLTLYYPDRLEYYRSNKQVTTGDKTSETVLNYDNYYKSFEKYAEPALHPYGEIPVFHFRRTRRKIVSELQNVKEPQDSINKLLADMMIVSEFGAYPQRYIISQAGPGKFKNAPNEIWDVPASDGEGQPTSVGQFDPMQLSNYLDAIDKWVTAIAIISRTPKHYFFSQGGDPSGEALIAMETPLNKKAQKYIDRFMSPWSDIGRFLLKLDGMEVDANAVIPHFDKPETVQPLTGAEIRKKNVEAGIPLVTQLRSEGYTDQEIEQLLEDQAEAQRQQRATLAQAMTDAQRRFDQNGNGEE